MRVLFFAAAAVAAMTSASAQTPPPGPQGTIHAIAYVETSPANVPTAQAILRDYRAAAMAEDGSVAIVLMQEVGRGNRFVVDETWKDFAHWDAHAKAGKLANGLASVHLAPPDVRVHTEWSVAPVVQAAAGLHVYTHIDVAPPQLAGLQAILTPYLEKSRSDRGLTRFDLLQSLPPRLNHQTLVEAWASEADFVAHETSAHAIGFRDRLGPLLGALYDQRLFAELK